MWERIGEQPGVEGGRIRQYTAAGGAPMVYGVEGFEYEARLECVLSGRASGHLGYIARASAVEGASARSTKPPVNEDTCMR